MLNKGYGDKGEFTDENDYSGQYRRQNMRYEEFKLKMDIPSFNGALHIEEFIEWMIEIERFFDYMNIEKKRQVKMIVLRFKGVAFV